MKRLADPKRAATRSLLAFFGLAFAWSWALWITAAVLGARQGSLVGNALLYAGTPGPLIAALALLYLRGTPAERRDFYRRIYEVERVSPRWLLATLLIYPGLTAAAVGLDWMAGGPLPDTTVLSQRLHDPQLLLATTGFAFLLGPLPEEPGWRGYALDRLQLLGSALTASLWLGFLWALWHLPLFFIPGSYHHDLGFATLAFWLFVLTAIAGSVIITWIYGHNERSVFGAILFHATLNFTRDALHLSDRSELARTALLVLFATIVVVRCRPGTLGDCRRSGSPGRPGAAGRRRPGDPGRSAPAQGETYCFSLCVFPATRDRLPPLPPTCPIAPQRPGRASFPRAPQHR